MTKPVFKDSFSVDDIRKLREYNYEVTKNMTSEERINYINSKADKVRKRIEKIKKEKNKLAI